jgi:uroporphyrinogen-III synthase
MRVLVTRPLRQAEATAERLRALGHEPVVAPLLSIEPTRERPPAGHYDALIVTSANAAPALASFEKAARVFAVGERTADEVRGAGFRDVLAAEGDALSLAALVARSLPAGARLLHLAGRDHKPEPRASLLAAGYQLDTSLAYEARAARELPAIMGEALRSGGIDAALHYSRRSAEAALSLSIHEGLTEPFVGLRHVCLSEDIAAPLRERGATRLIVAGAPDEASLLAALGLWE